MSHTVRRILLVDDDAAIRASLGEALRGMAYDVLAVASGAEALGAMARFAPSVVLSDIRMGEISGLELLTALNERVPHTPVILMTAFDDMPTVVEAMKLGAAEFLVKPLDLDELQDTVDRVCADVDAQTAESYGAKLASEGELVGKTPSMIAIFKLVGQAARSKDTVLIRGESGTGKELVARAIHGHSHVSGGPFVPVNCAALPANLLESELFGHVRGAFTGAVRDRRGRFAQAQGGTIFLDEIGDTNVDFQSKLLRVLQDREFQAVGSDITERTNARVVAATHRPLEEMIVDRTFREDLYYRLRVVEILLPPLRERQGDILVLATHILQRFASANGTAVAKLSSDAERMLKTHSWPGNVRELEHCLLRALLVAQGGVIRAPHLDLRTRTSSTPARIPTLEELERQHVTRVLEIVDGHKGRAAAMLGVSRPRLARLIEKFRLDT